MVDKKLRKGFTLIEILVVIAVITMLIGAVIVAINPGRQFSQARDTERWTGVNAVLNAVHQNMVDNLGSFSCPAAGSLPAAAQNMADPVTDPAGYDICSCVTPTYLGSMPVDPSTGSFTDCTTYDADYTIFQDAATGRITVEASNPELAAAISVSR